MFFVGIGMGKEDVEPHPRHFICIEQSQFVGKAIGDVPRCRGGTRKFYFYSEELFRLPSVQHLKENLQREE